MFMTQKVCVCSSVTASSASPSPPPWISSLIKNRQLTLKLRKAEVREGATLQNLHLGVVPLDTAYALIFVHTAEDWISQHCQPLAYHHPQGTVLIAPPQSYLHLFWLHYSTVKYIPQRTPDAPTSPCFPQQHRLPIKHIHQCVTEIPTDFSIKYRIFIPIFKALPVKTSYERPRWARISGAGGLYSKADAHISRHLNLLLYELRAQSSSLSTINIFYVMLL